MHHQKGPLAQEYEYRFKKKDRAHLRIPTAPKQMEWLEEPNLARALHEILRAEQDLETMKQSLSLKPDFNIADCYTIFDTQCQGFITRLQFEEVFTLH